MALLYTLLGIGLLSGIGMLIYRALQDLGDE